MKKLLKEFQDFAVKGNLVDMAVGVIIGGAFGKIVSSFVNDILMPLIGLLLGGLNFSSLHVNMGKASWNYGNFLQAIIDFLIVAGVIFMVIKGMNSLKKERKIEEEKAPDVVEEIKLLREIRDSLKK